ncbi:MAG: glutathione S-transferase C-terminal domain-containing protein, partial [Bradyrhizobium sp.]
MRDQFRANVDWIEAQLGDNRPFLFGEFSLADVSAYMNVWYARQSLATMDEMMKSWPRIAAWEQRIRA